jgi:acyl-CoA synthetase (NDP forming)
MLSAENVAWIGGSSMTPAIAYMQKSEFSGQAVAVNPTRAELAGLSCVKSVEDLPFVPDLSVLVIPKDAVVNTIGELAKIGCQGVVCITSGFSESSGGLDRQQDLIAAAGDMPVIGPNCPGFANFLDNRVFMMDHFGDHTRDRGVAVISNGGAYLSDLGCADRSQPIAYMIGLGNQATVGIADMMDALLDDPRVTAINVYFESLGDVASLSQAAAKAAQKGIPVVAVKGGRSEAGTRAAQSHTASLAGEAAIASALFRRFAWIEVTTPSEAIETLKMLSYTTLPAGPKTGFVTSSGSYAVLGGDLAEGLGLELDPPSAHASSALEDVLPPYVGAANPLDISDAHGWPLDDQLPIYAAFAKDAYDLFVQVMCYPPEGGWDNSTWDATTAAMAKAKGRRPAAFVNTLAESLPRRVRNRMISQGMAPLQGLEDGLRAVAHAAGYGQAKASLQPDMMLLEQVSGVRNPDELKNVDEATAKNTLARAGLDVPRHWRINKASELPKLDGHFALKALVPGLAHKTEAGAVALNVPAEGVEQAMLRMSEYLVNQHVGYDGFLLEEMITDLVAEMLVGLRRVAHVGPVLTLSLGGTIVNLLDDSATLILPATRTEIDSAIRGLKLSPLLYGYRGGPCADMDAALDAVETMASYFIAKPEIVELEINPLMVTKTRAVIADAVLTIEG